MITSKSASRAFNVLASFFVYINEATSWYFFTIGFLFTSVLIFPDASLSKVNNIKSLLFASCDLKSKLTVVKSLKLVPPPAFVVLDVESLEANPEANGFNDKIYHGRSSEEESIP